MSSRNFKQGQSAYARYRAAAYHRRRRELIEMLGGRCENCGEEDGIEIHHLFGATWDRSKVNSYSRMVRYRKESSDGLIGLLCKKCNKRIRTLKPQ